jgi:hypothetical protein
VKLTTHLTLLHGLVFNKLSIQQSMLKFINFPTLPKYPWDLLILGNALALVGRCMMEVLNLLEAVYLCERFIREAFLYVLES